MILYIRIAVTSMDFLLTEKKGKKTEIVIISYDFQNDSLKILC